MGRSVVRWNSIMDGARRGRRARALLALGLALGLGARAQAADFSEVIEVLPPPPRFFPRGDGLEPAIVLRPPLRRVAGCVPYRAPVPTDAPDDPSYVGSPYGLGKPSYYGFRPPLGYDDPFDRPLRYCP